MRVPFTFVARGKDARGVEYITDGKLILRAELLAIVTMPAPSEQGVRELPPETFAQIFNKVREEVAVGGPFATADIWMLPEPAR